jgi:hypothetical protein
VLCEIVLNSAELCLFMERSSIVFLHLPQTGKLPSCHVQQMLPLPHPCAYPHINLLPRHSSIPYLLHPDTTIYMNIIYIRKLSHSGNSIPYLARSWPYSFFSRPSYFSMKWSMLLIFSTSPTAL